MLIHCCNLQSSWEDEKTRKVYSCIDLYFVSQVSFSSFIMFCLLKNLVMNPYFIMTSLILQIGEWIFNFTIGWFFFQIKVQVSSLFLCSHKGKSWLPLLKNWDFLLSLLIIRMMMTWQDKMEMDVEAYLRRRYESQIVDIEIMDKEDLDLVS